MRENKLIVFPILIFILWSFVLFLSLWINVEIFTLQSSSFKLISSHFLIWILGIAIIIYFLFKIQKLNYTIQNQNENKKDLFNICDFFTNPALIIDKSTNVILKANEVALNRFNIKEQDKEIAIDQIDCLFQGIPKYKDSVIKNMKLENTCFDENGNEFPFEVYLHDFFLGNKYVTLSVIIDKSLSEAEKNIQEMNEYIEDLQAKDDVLEDNAFELIQLNIKLEESEKNLREANASKDKFFSIVAHDLKSPFVGLLGITEMLDTDYDDFEEVERREFIHSLYDISKNTFELLEGLLEWARVKQGRIDFSPQEFNFFQLADSLTNLLKANAFKKDIKLINSVDLNSSVYADRDMISTVLRNLLANAIKFTPANGTVEIKTEITDDLMKVSVIDSGIGISPQNQEKLFRIDVNHTTLGTSQEKGTGLGLILCKELIQNHKTDIWVESKLNEGSAFIFTLPLNNKEDKK